VCPPSSSPSTATSPFWGRLVRDLGVGPDPIPRRRLTAAGLADAIDSALGDPAMANRASALGASVRTEDGVGTTVAAIERWLG